MTWRLFLDDERDPESSIEHPGYRGGVGLPYAIPERFSQGDPWVVARSVSEALDLIAVGGMPDFIAFDHDLGKNVASGYDLAKTLVDMDLDGAAELPEHFSFEVHSSNPVGRENISRLLLNYLDFRKRPAPS